MQTRFKINATGSVDVVHSCDCECCTLPETIRIHGVFDGIVEAGDTYQAETIGLSGLYDAIENQIPDGYYVNESTADQSISCGPLSNHDLLVMIDYPTIPGLLGG